MIETQDKTMSVIFAASVAIWKGQRCYSGKSFSVLNLHKNNDVTHEPTHSVILTKEG